MTHSEKLAAILAAVQTDPGNRGLARVPDDNLFTATAGDFERACRSLSLKRGTMVGLLTGFYIPSADPPAFETDGPLGALFLATALKSLRYDPWIYTTHPCNRVLEPSVKGIGAQVRSVPPSGPTWLAHLVLDYGPICSGYASHLISVEAVGPSWIDGRSYNMRGKEITEYSAPLHYIVEEANRIGETKTIGIGDGGNEIGMGKIPHETIVKNIPNGDLIACRVPTDHLIVAGVSNWGAYALAAGLFVLLDRKPPPDLFNPDRELAILEAMVREGPLVDGVTGKQTATVDGLTWEEYSRPLRDIQRIMDS